MNVSRRLLPVLLALVLLAVSVPVLSPSAVGRVDTNERLVLHFDFEPRYVDGETVRDRSRAGNHGVFVGDAPAVSHDPGRGLRVTSESGHVRVDVGEAALSGGFTVTTRVRNSPLDYHAAVVSTAPWMVVATSDRYELYVADGTIRTRSVDVGEWHHLAVVHRSGTIRFFVDGELVGSRPATGDLSTETVWIGRRPNGYPYEGRIDEVRIYDRALTGAEVRGIEAGRTSFRPVIYTDVFRAAASFGLVLVAVLLGTLEVGYRSR